MVLVTFALRLSMQAGKTALDWARERGHREIVALLEAPQVVSPSTQSGASTTMTAPTAVVPQAQFDALKERYDGEQRKRREIEQTLQQVTQENSAIKSQLAQKDQTIAQKDAELQTARAAYASECAAHQATQTALAQFKAAATTAQLLQKAQGLVGKGHGLTLDELCVLAQFWALDIKADVLGASNLTLQSILQSKAVALKKKLSCNYGTAVALISFLRKLATEATLAPSCSGCTDLLDTALERANCPALKQLFVAQGVADDVLFDVELPILAAVHEEIAEHMDALEEAIQSLRTSGAALLVPADRGAHLLLKTE
eukprot:m.129341 g.129341  ORF g.129341 m.129341 type:complete len:315 (+) comp52313_c1_seq2:127-1071(+)